MTSRGRALFQASDGECLQLGMGLFYLACPIAIRLQQVVVAGARSQAGNLPAAGPTKDRFQHRSTFLSAGDVAAVQRAGRGVIRDGK